MLLSNMRSSGRKRKPKIIFQPGPTKEDLAFAEKRRLGAHQMWERRRVNELLAKTLPTPNEPSITTIIIPYRVAWAMAENASLSSKNTDAIRKCEMPGHYERVMMPSASAIHRENYDLEKWAEGFFSLPIQYIPATCDKGKQAEGYGFERQ